MCNGRRHVPLWHAQLVTHRVTHRVRLHLAMSLLHLLCNQKLHRRLVQPIGLVDRLPVFKKVHLTISSFLKAVFEAVVLTLCLPCVALP